MTDIYGSNGANGSTGKNGVNATQNSVATNGYAGTPGGYGGLGASMLAGSSNIYGGNGGHGGNGGNGGLPFANAFPGGLGGAGAAGGNGGIGVSLTGPATYITSINITGGNGGDGGSGGVNNAPGFPPAYEGRGGNGGTGAALYGVSLTSNGSISGGSAGVGGALGDGGPSGKGGLGVYLDGGTLINHGSVAGGNSFTDGSAGAGVLVAAGSLYTSGSISAGTGGSLQADAVQFQGSGSLTVEAGAVFNGTVAGNANYDDKLYLSGVQSGGTAITLGDQFTGFSSLNFEQGASFTADVGAGAAPSSSGLTVSGFVVSDTIDVTNLTPKQVAGYFGDSGSAVAGVYAVAGSAAGLTLATSADGTLNFTGDYAGDTFDISSDGNGGANITIGPVQSIESTITKTVSIGASSLPPSDVVVVDSPLIIGRLGSVAPTRAYGDGVESYVQGSVLKNYGSIRAAAGAFGGDGVNLYAGGTVTNAGAITGGASTGSFDGGTGVSLAGGVLDNSGTITGGAGGADTVGGAGVYIYGVTLTTSGTISGGASGADVGGTGYAVQFGSVRGSELIAEPGAVFNGAIGGFRIGDSVEIAGVSATQVASDFGVTAVALGGGEYQFQASRGGDTLSTAKNGTLDFDTVTPHYYFDLTNTSAGTLITLTQAPCYLCGTQILTPRGEIPIELLRIGDEVMTLDGTRMIRWIGRRAYSHDATANSRAVWPIRIERAALGNGLPRRDLLVSPEHALFIDGMLIPASALLNEVSICREAVGFEETVTYFHLEFDRHAVIYAEGAPAESFVDDDSRGMFDNAAEYGALYPHAAREPVRFCAPRVEEGEELQRVRQRLLARSPGATSSRGPATQASPLPARDLPEDQSWRRLRRAPTRTPLPSARFPANGAPP